MEDKNGVTRGDVLNYSAEKFDVAPEYLWAKYPDYAVLRRADNKKWYAIIMDVPKEKLFGKGDGRVDIVNVKCEITARDLFLEQKGILPAYHMNKESWLSILLDGSVEKQTVLNLVGLSYDLVGDKPKKR